MLSAAWCLYLADFLCVQTLREASAPKAPVWSPWTNNDCAASLLSSTQALHTVVSGFLKHSSHNRSGMPVFNGPAVSLAAPNRRETDPTHDWLRNSIIGWVPWSKPSQFRDAHVGFVQVANHRASQESLALMKYTWNSDAFGSTAKPMTKEADWDWPLLCAIQQTMPYLLHNPPLCRKKRRAAMTSGFVHYPRRNSFQLLFSFLSFFPRKRVRSHDQNRHSGRHL